MKYLIAIVLGSMFFFSSCDDEPSPEPIVPFEKNYGGVQADYSVATTNLGDAIYIAGTSQSLQATSGGLSLLKINTSGELLFEKSYGGAIQDKGLNMISTQDGNLLLLGFTNLPKNPSGTQVDIFLVKVNPNGDTLWTRTYGDPGSFDVATGIIETDNGEILLLGPVGNGVAKNVRVFRLDAQGFVLWEKIYNSPYNDNGIDIAAIGNDTYFLLGRRQDGDYDFYLMKIDGQGNVISTKTYGTPQYEEAHSIYKTQSGDFLLCGHSSGLDPLHNLYVVKIDVNGNVLFEKHYGGAAHDGGTAVVELSNGDLVFVGETDSYGNGSRRAFFVRTDKNGIALEESSYGGDLSDNFSAVCAMGGAYYMVGESKSITTDGNLDVYVVKKAE